jgi:hypothetical protein
MSCVTVQAPTRVIARASQRAALPCASGSLLNLCCETLPQDASDCGRHSVHRGTVSDTRADDDYSYSIAHAPLPRQPAAAVGSVTRCYTLLLQAEAHIAAEIDFETACGSL